MKLRLLALALAVCGGAAAQNPYIALQGANETADGIVVSQPRTVSCRSSNSITVTNPFSCQGSICPILCPGIGRYVLNMEKFSQQARQRLGGMDHHHFHSVPLLSGHEKHPSAPSLCREGTGGAFGRGQDFPQDWLALARSYSRT